MIMEPAIWYRASIAKEEEIGIAQKYFKCVDFRIKINRNNLCKILVGELGRMEIK